MQKMGMSPVGKVIIVCSLLQNAHTWLYGNFEGNRYGTTKHQGLFSVKINYVLYGYFHIGKNFIFSHNFDFSSRLTCTDLQHSNHINEGKSYKHLEKFIKFS